MPIKYIPFIPEPIEGQAVLGNFNRILKYLEKLANAFCYAIYNKDDNYIVKLKVDYIKHNTTVAFPTILLLKDNIKEIQYEITSKNNPEIISGTLIVKTDA